MTANEINEKDKKIVLLADAIIHGENKPACVDDDICIANGGAGFNDLCSESCPYVLAKEIIRLVERNKTKLKKKFVCVWCKERVTEIEAQYFPLEGNKCVCVHCFKSYAINEIQKLKFQLMGTGISKK